MKKSLLLGLLGLAATTLSTFGQGLIVLDNYDSDGPIVTYGQAGIPANGTSGAAGVQGAGVLNGSWTVQAYFAIGSITVPTDPSHIQDPGTLGLTAGTGVGSTAPINGGNLSTLPAWAGYFKGNFWAVPGTSSAGGQTITLEIAAYSGSSYDTSLYGGHSEAFTMVTSPNTSPSPNPVGTSMPAFSVYFLTPEPSVFALTSIGAAALMLFRRKK